MRTLKLKTNKNGNNVALVSVKNTGFAVYIQKVNYLNGRNVAKWFICQPSKQSNKERQLMQANGIELSLAEEIFNKKAA